VKCMRIRSDARMRRKFRALVVRSPYAFMLTILAILAAGHHTASGAPPATVHAGFRAVITGKYDPALYVPDEIEVGDTLTGYYAYEMGAIDSHPSPHAGVYQYTAPPNLIAVFADDGWVFRTDDTNVEITVAVTDSFVYQGIPSDGYLFYSVNNTASSYVTGRTLPMARMWIDLKDYSLTAITGDALPSSPPDLSAFQDWRQLLLEGVDWTIFAEVVSVIADPGTGVRTPKQADGWLGNAAPNPFNPSTSLPIHLGAAGRVALVIYDTRGRRVTTLVDQWMEAGSYHIPWDGRDGAGDTVASGIYFCRLTFDGNSMVRKITLLK
jgi:hypothetical protein